MSLLRYWDWEWQWHGEPWQTLQTEDSPSEDRVKTIASPHYWAMLQEWAFAMGRLPRIKNVRQEQKGSSTHESRESMWPSLWVEMGLLSAKLHMHCLCPEKGERNIQEHIVQWRAASSKGMDGSLHYQYEADSGDGSLAGTAPTMVTIETKRVGWKKKQDSPHPIL